MIYNDIRLLTVRGRRTRNKDQNTGGQRDDGNTSRPNQSGPKAWTAGDRAKKP